MIDGTSFGEAPPQTDERVEIGIAIDIGVIGDSFDDHGVFQPESDFDPDFDFEHGDHAALRL